MRRLAAGCFVCHVIQPDEEDPLAQGIDVDLAGETYLDSGMQVGAVELEQAGNGGTLKGSIRELKLTRYYRDELTSQLVSLDEPMLAEPAALAAPAGQAVWAVTAEMAAGLQIQAMPKS